MRIKAITAAGITAATLLAISPASALDPRDAIQLRKVEKVFVKVFDEVKDGCLSNPNALKIEAELVLRQSGITVLDTLDLEYHVLEIDIAGADTKSGLCVVSAQYELLRMDLLHDGSLALIKVLGIHVANWGNKPLPVHAMRGSVNGRVSVFANEILKARQNAQ